MRKHPFIKIILPALIIIFSFSSAQAQNVSILIKQWGELGDKPGQFKFPAMIISDKNSNIYVVDQHNHRIQKFAGDGTFIAMWGKPGSGPGEFNFPYGIAIDSKGYVYVSDMNNNRIQKFSPDGEFISLIGSYGTSDGQFKYPYGIVIDRDDILFVIDAFNYRIQKFDTDLKFLEKWGTQESIGFRLYMPHEIAVASANNIILSDRQNHRISAFTKDGALVKRFGEFGEGEDAKGGQVSEPHGVAVNEKGGIFICDRYNFRVQKFGSDGKSQTQWVTSGILDDSKHFPLGITTTIDGSIYVTDHYAHCAQKYSIVK
jgi:DNA-binding beta-propeller fold protein YncE